MASSTAGAGGLPVPPRAEESVKVVVRIRPLSQQEQEDGRRVVAEADEALGQIVVRRPDGGGGAGATSSFSEGKDDDAGGGGGNSSSGRVFTFDAVFGPGATQRQVYDVCAAEVVESVLDGYNGTIFAYGQTGTGKTHTMEGRGLEDPEERGIIPRSFQHIFSRVAAADHAGQQFLVRASYLEIYNEEVRDLLAKDPRNKLELKESPDKGVYAKDLTSYVVKSAEETQRVLQRGKRNRATGATLMNQTSSRSHSIFTIVVECASATAGAQDGAKPQQPQQQGGKQQHIRVGKLNLVDLAGSERQSKTGATGERFKEATKINLSLSALGNVISALVDGRAQHVPYRDSKLTRLLMDSLGGNTKTVMCANCGPADYNYDETLSTLRYANRAKNIKNKPRVNEDPKDTMLREFQAEIERLRLQLLLQSATGGGNGPMPLLAEPKDEAKAAAVVTERVVEKLVGLSEAEARALEAKVAREARRAADAALAAQSKEAAAREHQLRERLSKESEERRGLQARLQELEAKLICGGDVEGLDSGGGAGADRQRRLAQDLAIQEEAHLALEEEYSSLQEEVEAKTRKLHRLWARCQAQERGALAAQEEAQREREELLDAVRQLTRQLKLKDLLLASFVPPDDAARLEARARWSEEQDAWTLPRMELAGNNLLAPGARLARPVATAGAKRPETRFARRRRPYDADPRFRSDNILELDLEPAPKGTTQHYRGAATVLSGVARVLDVALDAEEEAAVPSSPFLRYASVVPAVAASRGQGAGVGGGGGSRRAAVEVEDGIDDAEEEEEEFPTARGLGR